MHTVVRLLVLFAAVLAATAERIVRFVSSDEKIYFGDAILPADTTDAAQSTSARVISGDIFGNFSVTEEVKVSLHYVYVKLLPQVSLPAEYNYSPLSTPE